MFYENITVMMPSKKRITKNGHRKPYVYEVLARKNDQNPRDIVRCVGIAVDENTMHPNENYFLLHPETSSMQPLGDAGTNANEVRIGRSVLLQRIGSQLGLVPLLQKHFPEECETFLLFCEFLLSGYPFDPRLFRYYLYDHGIVSDQSVHDLSFSLSHERIRAFLNEWKNLRLAAISESGSIDFFFESLEPRHPSIHTLFPQPDLLPPVSIGVFLEHETGIPLFFSFFHGSILAMDHIQTALQLIGSGLRHPIETRHLVTDRFFNAYNLSWAGERCSFVSVARRGTQFAHLVHTYPPDRIISDRYHIRDSLYGVGLSDTVFPHDRKQYHIYLYYNAAYDEACVRPLLADTVSSLVGEHDDQGRLRELYEDTITLQTGSDQIITQAFPDSGSMTLLDPSAGYFWLVSNEELSPAEALRCFEQKHATESVMRIHERSFHGAGNESRLFFSFLSAVLHAQLSSSLAPFFRTHPNETLQTVFAMLDRIRAVSRKGSYQLACALTQEQREILSIVGLMQEDVRHTVRILNQKISLQAGRP